MPHMTPNFYFNQAADHWLERFPQIRMLSHRRISKAHRLTDHTNDGIEICCAIQGEFSWNIEGRRVTIRKEEVSITYPWQIHSGLENTISRGDLAFIILQPYRFTGKGELSLGSWSRLPLDYQKQIGKRLLQIKNPNIGRVPGLVDCLDAMGREILGQEEGCVTRVHAILDELFILLGRHLKTPVQAKKDVPSGIQRALEAVNKDSIRPWTLTELKNIARYKGTSFIKHFKQLTGMAPHQYLISKRIDLAKIKLRSGNQPLTQIAYELNFSSSQHFSGVFRKWTGDSPKDYRKSHGG